MIIRSENVSTDFQNATFCFTEFWLRSQEGSSLRSYCEYEHVCDSHGRAIWQAELHRIAIYDDGATARYHDINENAIGGELQMTNSLAGHAGQPLRWPTTPINQVFILLSHNTVATSQKPEYPDRHTIVPTQKGRDCSERSSAIEKPTSIAGARSDWFIIFLSLTYWQAHYWLRRILHLL